MIHSHTTCKYERKQMMKTPRNQQAFAMDDILLFKYYTRIKECLSGQHLRKAMVLSSLKWSASSQAKGSKLTLVVSIFASQWY